MCDPPWEDSVSRNRETTKSKQRHLPRFGSRTNNELNNKLCRCGSLRKTHGSLLCQNKASHRTSRWGSGDGRGCELPVADDLCFPSDEPMGERGRQGLRVACSRWGRRKRGTLTEAVEWHAQSISDEQGTPPNNELRKELRLRWQPGRDCWPAIHPEPRQSRMDSAARRQS